MAVVAPGFPDWSSSIDRVRRVGRPWIDAWLERETSSSSARYFPLFGAFIVSLVFGLYRSWRALAAILIVARGGGAPGDGLRRSGRALFHHRLVAGPPDPDGDCHREPGLPPLAFCRSTGGSRPRDPPHPGPGQQVHRRHSVGLRGLGRDSAHSLSRTSGRSASSGSGHPAVSSSVGSSASPSTRRFRPSFAPRPAAAAGSPGRGSIRAAEVLPLWSYRWRWPLVIAASMLALAGLIALFGIPGVLPGMQLETDSLAYIDPDEPVARDTRYFEETRPRSHLGKDLGHDSGVRSSRPGLSFAPSIGFTRELEQATRQSVRWSACRRSSGSGDIWRVSTTTRTHRSPRPSTEWPPTSNSSC